MPEFLFVTVVLTLLACLFILSPRMMTRSDNSSSRRQANVTLFQERLSDLKQELKSNDISEQEFKQLSTELQRRLLDDTPSQESLGNEHGRIPFKWALTISLFIALLAGLFYQQTGAKADWEISNTLKQARHKSAAGQSTEAEVQHLISQLNDRLVQRPEDPHYLMLLGSTYMELQNYPAATQAYQRLSLVHPEDPSVLAQYTQALYLSSDRTLTPKIRKLSDQVLAINPQQSTILGLLGIAYFEQGDYRLAIQYWQRLLPMLGPVSPNRKMIDGGIAQAKKLLAESGVELQANEIIEPVGTSLDGRGSSISVRVTIAEHIKANADSVVFIFARAAAGPRMPLAVARLKVAQLPATITLDDSMAMAPGMNLSSFKEVELVARISKNGIANPGPGDFEGGVGPMVVALQDEPVSLQIDRVLK